MTGADPAPTPVPGVVDDDERRALSDAVTVLHGAVYAYGVVAAFAPPGAVTAVRAALLAHEVQRDRAGIALGDGAPVAAPAYDLPEPVTDERSALELALRVEVDTATGWRSALERSVPEASTPTSPTTSTGAVGPGRIGVRAVALAALTGCAVRAAGWQRLLGPGEGAGAFPGSPNT